MGCKSCKENSKKYGLDRPKTVIEDKSIALKSMIMVIKVILFLITSVIGSIVVVPFTIYTLVKVFFYDGTVDIEGLVVGASKWLSDRKDRKEEEEIAKEEAEESGEYDYDYAAVDEITEEER